MKKLILLVLMPLAGLFADARDVARTACFADNGHPLKEGEYPSIVAGTMTRSIAVVRCLVETTGGDVEAVDMILLKRTMFDNREDIISKDEGKVISSLEIALLNRDNEIALYLVSKAKGLLEKDDAGELNCYWGYLARKKYRNKVVADAVRARLVELYKDMIKFAD